MTWQGAPTVPTVTYSGQEALLASYLGVKTFELRFSAQSVIALLQKQVCGNNTNEINTLDCWVQFLSAMETLHRMTWVASVDLEELNWFDSSVQITFNVAH